MFHTKYTNMLQLLRSRNMHKSNTQVFYEIWSIHINGGDYNSHNFCLFFYWSDPLWKVKIKWKQKDVIFYHVCENTGDRTDWNQIKGMILCLARADDFMFFCWK